MHKVRIRREFLIQSLLLAAILCFVFPRTFFFGEMVHPGGLLFEMAPWKHHVPAGLEAPANPVTVEYLTCFHAFFTASQQSLTAGEWPLWNPLEFAGVPLHANYQSTIFYPPRILHSMIDVAVASSLLMILKFWLCGMTAYVYGRVIRLNVWPARFLSVAWMLSSYNLLWCYWPLADVGAWVPLLLAGVELLLRDRHRQGFAIIAIAATLLLLAGHPESAFAAGIGAGLLLICRLIFEFRSRRRIWITPTLALLAWAPALLISSSVLIPFFEYLTVSHEFALRSEASETSHAFSASSAVTLFVPRYFGTEADGNHWGALVHTFQGMMYAGVFPWIGITLLFIRRGTSKTSAPLIASLLIPCALLLILSFDLSILHSIQHLPLIETMWKCYFVAFPMFAIATLGAIGLDRFLSQPRRLLELAPAYGGGIMVAGFIGLIWSIDSRLLQTLKVATYVQTQIEIFLLFSVIGIILLTLSRKKDRGTLTWLPIVLILTVDLLVATRGMRTSIPRDALFYSTPLTDYLQKIEDPHRINAVSGGLLPGLMVPYGVEEQWGHDGIYPKRIITFYGRLGESLWNAMEPGTSTTHYLRGVGNTKPGFPYEDKTRFALQTTLDGIEVYKNKKALPRAYLVEHYEVIEDENLRFDRMSKANFNPAITALLEYPLENYANGSAVAAAGNATVRSRTPNKIVIEVDSPNQAILVNTDAYYPGWSATLNGNASAIFPVNHAFRGIAVPPGKHTVVMEYFPQSFAAGLGISVATLLSCSGLAVAILARGKNKCEQL